MQFPLGRSLTVLPLAVCLGATALVAGSTDRPDSKPAGKSTPGVTRPAGPTSAAPLTRTTAIIGTAWTANNAPIKQASLRLRNIVTGKVLATTVADDAGQFSFDNVPGGSYVVELLDGGGRVEVVGQAFTIAQGETVATFVRRGANVPWFTGFFSNAVTAVTAAAASQGVAAIAPLARPVSSAK